jgi:hypothetical protein
MAGMGYNPLSKYFLGLVCSAYPGKDDEISDFYEQWKQHKQNLIAYVKELPSHYQFLKDTIYKDKE